MLVGGVGKLTVVVALWLLEVAVAGLADASSLGVERVLVVIVGVLGCGTLRVVGV